MNRGFSLVELSIVLVILGLLTGGILAGQSLIRAAELRSVTTELSTFDTAINTFRGKYFALPGDMRNATQFWLHSGGAYSDCATNSAAASGSPGVCDGDGDGLIELSSAPYNYNTAGENFQVWRHLQVAGLISGSNTGASPASGASPQYYASIGSRIGALWHLTGDFSVLNSAANYPVIPANTNGFILFGHGLYNSAMKQEELWNIDTKIDDGKPSTGRIGGSRQALGGPGACMNFNPSETFYKIDDGSGGCVMAAIMK